MFILYCLAVLISYPYSPLHPERINQQIAFECRLFVVGCNARLEAAVGGLDVAIPVVDADDAG